MINTSRISVLGLLGLVTVIVVALISQAYPMDRSPGVQATTDNLYSQHQSQIVADLGVVIDNSGATALRLQDMQDVSLDRGIHLPRLTRSTYVNQLLIGMRATRTCGLSAGGEPS